MQVCFLDHYDSFSFNLIDWLFSDTDLEVVYFPFDIEGLSDVLAATPRPLVLSPGPRDPAALPQTMKILQEQLGRVPILGICLGHQCLGVQLGGRITPAREPFHGTSESLVIQRQNSFIAAVDIGARVARYNSLVLERGSLPEDWVTAVNAWGEIEAIEWRGGDYPAFGLQFHPESFLSAGMRGLKESWLKQVHDFYRASE